MADRLAHAPDLPVAALVDGDAQRVVADQRTPAPARSGRRRAPRPRAAGASAPRDGVPSTSARYSFSTPKDGWVSRWASSPSLVRSSRPSVSASRRPTGNTRGLGGHQVDHRRAALRVGRRGHDARGLVQQVVDQALAHADPGAVDLDVVGLGIDPRAEGRHLAVDGDPARRDQVLAGPAAAEAGLGQHLLQALAGRAHPRRGRARTDPRGRRDRRGHPQLGIEVDRLVPGHRRTVEVDPQLGRRGRPARRPRWAPWSRGRARRCCPRAHRGAR